jgi:hypothetical protein
MSTATIPPCVKLLQITAEEANLIASLFDKKSLEFKQFKDSLRANKSFLESASFIKNESHVTYLQMLLLVGLSMHGGIFTPDVKDIFRIEKDNEVRLQWTSGASDKFFIGKITEDFKKFAAYVQVKLFAKNEKNLPISLLHDVQHLLSTYTLNLTSVKKRVETLMGGKKDIKTVLGKKMSQDLLFILLSSLPTEQMSALFLYIHQFLPEDLEVKTKDGNRVKIATVFGQPSTDILYLYEKLNIYFDLYYNLKLPIIQHITQSKTSDFLVKQLQNQKIRDYTFDQLKSLKERQLDLRLNLYHLFHTHLSHLLK